MKKKLLKIVSTSTLAVIMGAGVLCGSLIIPMNSPQTAMSGASTAGATASSNSANLAGAAQLGDSALNASGAATQENLVAGEAIQLNPQTDETIFTTENGFEIKSHTVAGQTVANSQVQYFTLGSYNGTPLNWIILASSPTIHVDSTPAGKAVNAETSKQVLSMMTDSKLSINQVLVISEKVFAPTTDNLTLTAHATCVLSPLANYYSTADAGGGFDNANVAINFGKALLNEPSDFYASFVSTPPCSSTINTWFSDSSFGLSGYLGNKIIKNSNFNGSYYGFALTDSQFSTYVPNNVRAATDTSGAARSYWCQNTITTSITNSVNYASANLNAYRSYRTTGSGTCTFSGRYVNTSGTVTTTTLATIKGTISDSTQTYWYSSYAWVGPQASYSLTRNAADAYLRPAMVVDITK